jgi:general secretion pathway protein H
MGMKEAKDLRRTSRTGSTEVMIRNAVIRLYGQDHVPPRSAGSNLFSLSRLRSAAGKGSSGLLLLDMALALTILLLLFAIIWPTFGGGTTNLQESATALDIATLLRTDRTSASRTGVPTATRIDLDRRVLTSANGRIVEVPADIALEVTTGAACMTSARRFVIVFSPDGSSCGGMIVLKKGGLSYAVRFNWLSGMIDVVHASRT